MTAAPGGRPVTDAFQDGEVFVREATLPADGCQGVTHQHPVFRLERHRQDLAHLGLGAAAMLLGLRPQGAVHVLRHVADRRDRHDAPSPSIGLWLGLTLHSTAG